MKKIEAVIVPSKLKTVRAELARRGIRSALTLTEVQHADARKISLSPEQETGEFLEDRLKVELFVGDRQAPKAMEVMIECAKGPANGTDGQVALLKVSEALQILPALPNH
jgi:nitrogen regulatory protein PII